MTVGFACVPAGAWLRQKCTTLHRLLGIICDSRAPIMYNYNACRSAAEIFFSFSYYHFFILLFSALLFFLSPSVASPSAHRCDLPYETRNIDGVQSPPSAPRRLPTAPRPGLPLTERSKRFRRDLGRRSVLRRKRSKRPEEIEKY